MQYANIAPVAHMPFPLTNDHSFFRDCELQTFDLFSSKLSAIVTADTGNAVMSDADAVAAETKQSIASAITHFASRTCIQFRFKTDNDVDYVYFIYQPGQVTMSLIRALLYKSRVHIVALCRVRHKNNP